MAKVVLVTVHGIGETPPDYADGLWRSVSGRLGAKAADVVFSPIYYQDLLQPNQQQVWSRMCKADKLRYEDLRKFLLFGFGDAAGLETQKEQPDSTYELAQVKVARALLSAFRAAGGPAPMVMIAQSLGGQVLSDYIYDAQRPQDNPPRAGIWADIDAHAPSITGGPPLRDEEKAYLRCQSLRRWITTGCNIPIFVATYPQLKILPIQPPHADFKWLNIYDADDILGWPLAPLSPGYAQLVEDRAINVGHGFWSWLTKSWNPLSHTGYWEDGDVLDPLVAMLKEFP